MAGDPLNHVATGQALEIPAPAYNLWCDMARASKRQRLGKNGGNTAIDTITAALTVKIVNTTMNDLATFSVLKLGSPLGAPEAITQHPFLFQSRPVLLGSTPAATNDPIGITQGPVQAGTTSSPGIGEAVIMGVAIVDVNITDAGHCSARPIPGDTAKLESADSGTARILWRPDESTGVKRCVVMLSGCGCGCSQDCTNCSGCRYAIAIFNSNGIIDDNFKLKLNGDTIQDNIDETFPGDPRPRGAFLHPTGFTTFLPTPIKDPGAVGNTIWTRYEVSALDDLSSVETLTFDLYSIFDNEAGNYGLFILYRVCGTSLCEVYRSVYNMPSYNPGEAASGTLFFSDPGNPLSTLVLEDDHGHSSTLAADSIAATIQAQLISDGFAALTVTDLGGGAFDFTFAAAGVNTLVVSSGDGFYSPISNGAEASDPEACKNTYTYTNPCYTAP